MNEKELYVVKEYKFDKPLITEIDSIRDSCYRDCHHKNFHTFENDCIYDIKLTNIADNENFNLTIIGKSMNLYDLNKNLKVARHNGFIFNQINKLTLKIYSHQRDINKCYYLKHQIPIMHRQVFRIISQNLERVERFCNNKIILFILHVENGIYKIFHNVDIV